MRKSLIVCDLDNTLYDWIGYFIPSFYAMVDEVVNITGCDKEQLLDDFREVHRKHGDSEHPFSLLETPTIQRIFSGMSLAEMASELDSALHAFNSARKKNLRLYPGVIEGLNLLYDSNIVLVAHTESKLYSVVDRLTRLKLTKYFRRIYCRERSESKHPYPERINSWLSRFPIEKIVELSRHQRKPDPTVLKEIAVREGVSLHATAYIGDSVARDMLMAKSASVFSIWAKYGTRHSQSEYERLVRISHWTDDDVSRERRLKKEAEGVEVDAILEHSFLEILSVSGLIDYSSGISLGKNSNTLTSSS